MVRRRGPRNRLAPEGLGDRGTAGGARAARPAPEWWPPRWPPWAGQRVRARAPGARPLPADGGPASSKQRAPGTRPAPRRCRPTSPADAARSPVPAGEAGAPPPTRAARPSAPKRAPPARPSPYKGRHKPGIPPDAPPAVACLRWAVRDRGMPGVRLPANIASYMFSVTCAKPALKFRFRPRQQRPNRGGLDAERAGEFPIRQTARAQQQQLGLARLQRAQHGTDALAAFLGQHGVQ